MNGNDGQEEFDIEKTEFITDFSEYEERERREQEARRAEARGRQEEREDVRRHAAREKAKKLGEILLRQCARRDKVGARALVFRLLEHERLLECLAPSSRERLDALNMRLRDHVGMHDAGKLRRAVLARIEARERREAHARKAERLSGDKQRVLIANHRIAMGMNEKGEAIEIVVALDADEVQDTFRQVNSEFPKRIGEQLFVDSERGLEMLANRHDLFAWFRKESKGPVLWRPGLSSDGFKLVTEDEVFSMASGEAEVVEAIEEHPIFPVPAGVYLARVARRPLVTRAGNNDFDELVGLFNPVDEASYSLIEALVLTSVWGGPPGQRPLFVVTGPRGAGKSTLVRLIARLVGGCAQIDVGHGRKNDPIAEQILADTNLTRRIVLIDNAEGYLRSSELSAWITSDDIEGRPSFGKRRRRLNFLTFVATVVDPSLDSDLAQRCVVLSLLATSYSSKWLQQAEEFIDKQRDSIIAEAFAKLRDPKTELDGNGTRFPSWDAAVLTATKYPDAVLASLGERHQVVNEDLESLARFLDLLRETGKPEMRPAELAECWNSANGSKLSTGWVIRTIKGHRSRGELPAGLRPKWERKNGTPWLVSLDELELEAAA